MYVDDISRENVFFLTKVERMFKNTKHKLKVDIYIN